MTLTPEPNPETLTELRDRLARKLRRLEDIVAALDELDERRQQDRYFDDSEPEPDDLADWGPMWTAISPGPGWALIIGVTPVAEVRPQGSEWTAKAVGRWRGPSGMLGSWDACLRLVRGWGRKRGVHVPLLAEVVIGPAPCPLTIGQLLELRLEYIEMRIGGGAWDAHLTAIQIAEVDDSARTEVLEAVNQRLKALGERVEVAPPGPVLVGEPLRIVRWDGDADATRVQLFIDEHVVASAAKDRDAWLITGHEAWYGKHGVAEDEAGAIAKIIEMGIGERVEVPPFYGSTEAEWEKGWTGGVLRLTVGGVLTARARPDGNAWTPEAWGFGRADHFTAPDIWHAVGEIIARAASQGIGVEWPKVWPETPAEKIEALTGAFERLSEVLADTDTDDAPDTMHWMRQGEKLRLVLKRWAVAEITETGDTWRVHGLHVWTGFAGNYGSERLAVERVIAIGVLHDVAVPWPTDVDRPDTATDTDTCPECDGSEVVEDPITTQAHPCQACTPAPVCPTCDGVGAALVGDEMGPCLVCAPAPEVGAVEWAPGEDDVLHLQVGPRRAASIVPQQSGYLVAIGGIRGIAHSGRVADEAAGIAKVVEWGKQNGVKVPAKARGDA